jgi:hypothetical protein
MEIRRAAPFCFANAWRVFSYHTSLEPIRCIERLSSRLSASTRQAKERGQPAELIEQSHDSDSEYPSARIPVAGVVESRPQHMPYRSIVIDNENALGHKHNP